MNEKSIIIGRQLYPKIFAVRGDLLSSADEKHYMYNSFLKILLSKISQLFLVVAVFRCFCM